MSKEEPLRLETDRCRLRPVGAGDLDDVYRVFASNPSFLTLREDIAAAPGGYDPVAVRQYWELADLDPDRHLLLAADRETGTTVGLVDFVDRSPADGLPWIGLVMVHRSHQRRGIGSEIVRAMMAHLASMGNPGVRMAVIEGNQPGLGFARSVGFQGYGGAEASTPGASRRVVLMELPLPLSPPES